MASAAKLDDGIAVTLAQAASPGDVTFSYSLPGQSRFRRSLIRRVEVLSGAAPWNGWIRAMFW